ncbi:hypothetical protein BDR04DRAFT_1210431 [Suillus decipiens]|nr:hypothetical protein BDR04DRAFT_1210431 [Suillus decipiens]
MSKDVFTVPSGPEQKLCHMELHPVYEHHILSKDDLWPTIHSQVVKLLDQQNIQHLSVDLAHFSWVKDDEENVENEDNKHDGGDKDGSNIKNSVLKLSLYGTVVTTPIMIWVGVLPDTLTGEVASKSSINILNLLREHGISDLNVVYHELVAKGSSGPELFTPISDLNPLKAIFNPVTTALGLPIAGLKMLYSQGTMGFYFKLGQDLYAITAHHVLFPENKGNNTYSYIAGPKKQVILMGSKAFHNFLISIKGHISIMNSTVDILEKAIEELKNFFVKMKRQWTKLKDQVIGHVICAPPISVHTAPHSYTVDVCVIKLNKKKFLQNFRGNALNLGPEIDPTKFINLMYPRINMPSDFNYPVKCLLKLQGILSAEGICMPNNRDHKGNPMRYVIECGHNMLTMTGCLNGFESHVHCYFTLGSCDSVEAAVYPYNNDSGPFSRGGDSGSIIVDALGKFVALLTGGTGPTNSSDIMFGTPMHWLWDIIKTQFPGANLYIEDDNN